MPKKNDRQNLFFSYTSDFLFLRLREQDLRSDNTVKAYRQGLNSFRLFMLSRYNRGVDKISFKMVTSDIVREYLKNLMDGGASLTTRNHRLTGLKQYMLYCAERDVELTQFYIAVSKIKHVTTHPKKRLWMTREAVQAILAQPPNTKRGVRDRFLMIFLYGTGARISVALNVKLNFVQFKASV